MIGVTLVIPAYNRADLIGETLDSVFAQIHPFDSVIVVNDGSTDNTSEVVLRYGDRVRLIEISNSGVQAARNIGIAASSTDYVVLCDSDDLLRPEYLSRIYPWLLAHPEIDVVYCNFHTFNRSGCDLDKLSLAPFDFVEGAVVEDGVALNIPDLYIRSVSYQPLFCSGVFIRKGFYSRIGGFDPCFRGVGGEDWEFTLRAISLGSLGLCLDSLVLVRKHDSNDSSDSLRMNMGEASILEYGLSHHSGASKWSNQIGLSIKRRRLAAFDLAFSRADWVALNSLLDRPGVFSLSLKFFVKVLVSKFPFRLRGFFWKILTRNL